MQIERALYRRFWLPIYRIYALRHVRSKRTWRAGGLLIEVPPGVFHPGIYFSTPIFMAFLQKLDLEGKTILDVGTGSGALAMLAAKKGAAVTAVDINPLAVSAAIHNAAANQLAVRVLQSDLFLALESISFDLILVNPPYYPKNPKNDTERAFFAGENYSYFHRFFAEVRPFCHLQTTILMILSEDCDNAAIGQIAHVAGFTSTIALTQKKWGEKQIIHKFSVRNQHRTGALGALPE